MKTFVCSLNLLLKETIMNYFFDNLFSTFRLHTVSRNIYYFIHWKFFVVIWFHHPSLKKSWLKLFFLCKETKMNMNFRMIIVNLSCPIRQPKSRMLKVSNILNSAINLVSLCNWMFGNSFRYSGNDAIGQRYYQIRWSRGNERTVSFCFLLLNQV